MNWFKISQFFATKEPTDSPIRQPLKKSKPAKAPPGEQANLEQQMGLNQQQPQPQLPAPPQVQQPEVNVVDQIPQDNMAPQVDPQMQEQPMVPDQEPIPVEQNLPAENPVNQKVFEIPETNLAKFLKKMDRVNKYAVKAGQPPIEFKVIPDISEKPYDKEIKLPNGTIGYMPARTIRLSGEPPTPKGTAVRTLRDEQGNILRDEMGQKIQKEFTYKLVASIEWLPVDPPREVTENPYTGTVFQNAQELQEFVGQQSEPDLWESGLKRNKQGAKVLTASYEGKYKNNVDHIPGAPEIPIDPRFNYTSPLLCHHCWVKKRGGSGRKYGFVAVEFDPDQLQGRQPTEEEVAKGKQIQVGSTCMKGHAADLKFLSELQNFRSDATGQMDVDKMRQSDSFGGGWQSWPKSFVQVLSNALEQKASTGRINTWRLRSWFGVFNDPDKDRTPVWGEPSEGAVQKATEIKDWWKGRENEPGLDRYDRNIANMAHQDKLGMDRFSIISKMVEDYDRAMAPKPEPIVEEPAIEEPAFRQPTMEDRNIKFDDVMTVPDGGSFRAKLTYVDSIEKSSRYGRGSSPYFLNQFTDEAGNKFSSFSKEPFKAEKGSQVYVEGIKVSYSRRWKNTQLKNVSNMAPEAAPIAEPEPMPEPVAQPMPEAPVEPIQSTEPGQRSLSDYVGKLNKGMKERLMSQDATKKMTPEKAIPIYMSAIKKRNPSFPSDIWQKSLMNIYNRDGQDALFKLLDNMPNLFPDTKY